MDMKVNAVELQVVKLTAKVLKQIPVISYDTLRKVLKKDEDTFVDGAVLGWIAESAHGSGYGPKLLVKLAEGEYGLFPCMSSTASKFKQIYIV